MNAALGGVSAGGLGTPVSDVTQRGGGPNAFVASHPSGRAGGIALSKFSLHMLGPEHGGQLLSARSIRAVVGRTATPAAMSKRRNPRLRDFVGMNVRFRFSVIITGSGGVLALAEAGVSGKA